MISSKRHHERPLAVFLSAEDFGQAVDNAIRYEVGIAQPAWQEALWAWLAGGVPRFVPPAALTLLSVMPCLLASAGAAMGAGGGVSPWYGAQIGGLLLAASGLQRLEVAHRRRRRAERPLGDFFAHMAQGLLTWTGAFCLCMMAGADPLLALGYALLAEADAWLAQVELGVRHVRRVAVLGPIEASLPALALTTVPEAMQLLPPAPWTRPSFLLPSGALLLYRLVRSAAFVYVVLFLGEYPVHRRRWRTLGRFAAQAVVPLGLLAGWAGAWALWVAPTGYSMEPEGLLMAQGLLWLLLLGDAVYSRLLGLPIALAHPALLVAAGATVLAWQVPHWTERGLVLSSLTLTLWAWLAYATVRRANALAYYWDRGSFPH